ncbi:hypothetical protein RMSM_06476 [Rhodopirellula maiorica SM1]|uniref:Uncharacterized protein n=2 Tax=Novipirellula TaxID=2795426 RepID=M5RMJ0_9BACT|nr:hypothetical protein RMSM_06476 [Rhodopirellula maiorica SM1]
MTRTEKVEGDQAMSFITHHCPSCHAPMREGFLIDRFGEFQKDTLFWASGSFGSFMLGREQVYPVTTWRCQHCGLLQCYAAPAEMRQGDHAAATTPGVNDADDSTPPQQPTEHDSPNTLHQVVS